MPQPGEEERDGEVAYSEVGEPVPEDAMALVYGKLAAMGVSSFQIKRVRKETRRRWLVEVFDWGLDGGYIWFWVQQWGNKTYEIIKILDEGEDTADDDW